MIGPGTIATARYAMRTDTPLVLHAHVTREDSGNSFRGPTPSRRRSAGICGGSTPRPTSSSARASTREASSNPTPSTRQSGPSRTASTWDDSTGSRDSANYRERYDVEGWACSPSVTSSSAKGLSTFCRVARRTDYDFTWYGTYESGPSASSTVRKWTKNPPENVTFTGWVDDIRGAYGAGDVFMFPAKVENQGIVVLEAMACGKAVVPRTSPSSASSTGRPRLPDLFLGGRVRRRAGQTRREPRSARAPRRERPRDGRRARPRPRRNHARIAVR